VFVISFRCIGWENVRYQASFYHHLNKNWMYEKIAAIRHWNKIHQISLFDATLLRINKIIHDTIDCEESYKYYA
ncbi:UNVERIFIED_CONTAM: hypothetical protein NY100_30480, partial [Prevotella sp. 15_C9]